MMSVGRFRFPSTGAVLAILGLGAAACRESSTVAPELSAARTAAGPSVTSADPAYGHQGDVGLAVRIYGSGFGPGAQASWERNGTPDARIHVVSTQVVSSTELVATISIAPDAVVTFYDVAVVSGGKKGIGTEMFEVSTAIAIDGTQLARAVNDNGDVTGQIPMFFWNPSAGLQSLGSDGSGWGVSEDGLTLVGGVGAGPTAVIWTRNGTGWVQANLPRNPAAGAGNARAVASDPTTGAATVIGGVETFVLKGNRLRKEPRLWIPNGGAWQLTVLPGIGSSTEGFVTGVNASQVAVGTTPSGATVWSPNGSGGWAAAVIGPAGSEANAINSAGDLIVGRSGGVAVYWRFAGAAWSGPIVLPGGCLGAKDVADDGRIIANACTVTSSRTTAVTVDPPYGVANVTYLPGFGDRTDGAQAESISLAGHWIVGRARLGTGAAGTIVAAYWHTP